MDCATSKRGRGARQAIPNEAAGGQGKKPSPDDPLDDSPFHAAETFDCADAHDRRGDYVRGGERYAVVTGTLNNQRGARLRRKSVHWLQFHHTMAKRANDSPATRGCSSRHGRGTKNRYPHRQRENGRLEKIQPAGQMIEAARFRAGKKRE